MITRYGLQRMALLNSAGCDYAIIPLDAPVGLLANNDSKTSLINSFQFALATPMSDVGSLFKSEITRMVRRDVETRIVSLRLLAGRKPSSALFAWRIFTHQDCYQAALGQPFESR